MNSMKIRRPVSLVGLYITNGDGSVTGFVPNNEGID